VTERLSRHPRRWSTEAISLRWLGLAGFAGSVCILIGTAQRGSPFVLKAPGAWFFGIGAHATSAGTNRNDTFLGAMLVYLGLALMIGSWYEVVRTVRRTSGRPLTSVIAITISWALPVFVMPPLFSRDVYSYAAQGDLVTRGVNPYLHGPGVLPSGRFRDLVDPLWLHARAPYGPAWERLSEGIVALGRHDVLATLVGFRMLAALGVMLLGWAVVLLARSLGRDETTAFALGVSNPVVLLVLVGGAHNDALMLGLLAMGCALARRNHVLLGLAFCAVAAEVKAPALIGAVFIGWWWSGTGVPWRRRLPRLAAALLVAIGAMVVIGAVSGLGWRWVGGLSDPGVVVSWGDPATAVGLALHHVAEMLGAGHQAGGFVDATRVAALLVAALISVILVTSEDRIGPLQALGWSLLAIVVLGPVIWPWYETWGFVFLAVVAEGWTLRLVLFLSAVACFADLPGGRVFSAINPGVAVLCWVCLLGAVGAYALVRLVPAWPGFPVGDHHFRKRGLA
jgi:alpha-1,6-mannosyltransferase